MRLNAFKRPASYRLSRLSILGKLKVPIPTQLSSKSWNATKPPLITHETVDKYAFERASWLPLTPKLGAKGVKAPRIFIIRYDVLRG